ncbi:MAG: hypothetical protein EPN22_02940 [Nitrospirae bacterium]|nr:MAG: hypothetical protein EPN22_02940 [Nitrospirota bacterium]
MFRKILIIACLAVLVGCAPRAYTADTEKKEAKPDPHSVEYLGFFFKFSECRSVKDKISCDVMITNRGEERTLMATAEEKGLFAERDTYTSRIFDDLGNEYYAKRIRFGAKESIKPQTLLLKNVPTKATLNFSGINPVPKTINILEVGFFSKEHGVFKVWFRDIKLVK